MKRFGILLVLSAIFFGGCSAVSSGVSGINTVTKSKKVTSNLFGGNIKTLDEEFGKVAARVQNGEQVTKEDVVSAGFDFYSPDTTNTLCVRGPDAMQYVLGTENNRPNLSNAKEIEEYTRAIMAYETCLILHQDLASKHDRFFFNEKVTSMNGTDRLYIMTFKDDVLFNARTKNISKNERETENAIGGNVLEFVIGTGSAVGRKGFR